jgi:hypothetical protein
MINDSNSSLDEWIDICQLQLEDIPQYLQVLGNLTEVGDNSNEGL